LVSSSRFGPSATTASQQQHRSNSIAANSIAETPQSLFLITGILVQGPSARQLNTQIKQIELDVSSHIAHPKHASNHKSKSKAKQKPQATVKNPGLSNKTGLHLSRSTKRINKINKIKKINQPLVLEKGYRFGHPEPASESTKRVCPLLSP
jgi:hypothetical protein